MNRLLEGDGAAPPKEVKMAFSLKNLKKVLMNYGVGVAIVYFLSEVETAFPSLTQEEIQDVVNFIKSPEALTYLTLFEEGS